MRLVLNLQLDAAGLEHLKSCLSTPWEILERRPGMADPDFARLLAEADACVSMRWNKDMLPAPNLKLLQTTGAGCDSVDFSLIPANCQVCNVYEHEGAIAEYLVLAILESEIGLSRMSKAMRQGDWTVGAKNHGQLEGKTVGLVGYGHIAKETARRLKPFGVRVLARTRTPEKRDEFVDEILGMGDLDSMLAQADYVALTCPLNEATRGLINEAAFKKMKPEALLLNVARAAVVDEKALYEACKTRQIRGAVIDTWYQYPSEKTNTSFFGSRYPLQELDNVVMSPHASANIQALSKRRWTVIAGNLNRLAKGEALIHVVKN